MTARIACATECISYTIVLSNRRDMMYMNIEENQSNGVNMQNNSYYDQNQMKVETQERGNGYRAIEEIKTFQETQTIHLNKKKLLMFPYPVFVTLVYLTIGCVFNWWHPTWLLFLTIPLYYPLVASLDEKECVKFSIPKARQ
jgi:hypothetical protein